MCVCERGRVSEKAREKEIERAKKGERDWEGAVSWEIRVYRKCQKGVEVFQEEIIIGEEIF